MAPGLMAQSNPASLQGFPGTRPPAGHRAGMAEVRRQEGYRAIGTEQCRVNPSLSQPLGFESCTRVHPYLRSISSCSSAEPRLWARKIHAQSRVVAVKGITFGLGKKPLNIMSWQECSTSRENVSK